MLQRAHMTVTGKVQGVGFRWFVQRTAEAHGITGWVRNIPDGSVAIEAEGEAAALARFAEAVRTGHPAAHVSGIRSDSTDVAARMFPDFSIKR